jgi:predicted DNA-binding transcriptional regulator AlpA
MGTELMTTPKPNLAVEDAARFVGVSVSVLNKLRVYGGGPAYLKIGRRVVYETPALEAWLASKRRLSTSTI